MRIIISLLICVFSIAISGQTFAPKTSVWRYTYDPSPALQMGIQMIHVIGDTTILGKNCRILEKRNIGYDYFYKKNYNNADGIEIVYSDTVKVYYYRSNQFYTLYDFSASVGSSWTIAGAKIKVDSISSTIINAEKLRVLYVHTDSGNYAFGSNKIIERLGCKEYLFPNITGYTGPTYPGPLRCFYDDTFGLYKILESNCDPLYVNIENENSDEVIQVIPNPVTFISKLEWKGKSGSKYTLNIYDYSGRLVKMEQTCLSSFQIIRSDFKTGLYIYRLTENNIQIGVGKFEVY